MTTTPLFFTPHLHPNKYAHTSMKTTLKSKSSIESIISLTLQMNHGFPHTHTHTTKKKKPIFGTIPKMGTWDFHEK